MKDIRQIILNEQSSEELLPDFAADFPYIATHVEMECYPEPMVPWHWHRTVELFYLESGEVEYTTPNGRWRFAAGSGGMVNSNALHATRLIPTRERQVQLLHLFDPAFLAGEHGSRIEEKYILPLTAAPELEMIALYPDDSEQAEILKLIRQAFELDEQSWGYELLLRERLSEIWLRLLHLARPAAAGSRPDGENEKIKTLMIYVHEHYSEPISIDQLAAAARVSKRACFRLFRDKLHMTPLAYITACRMQAACRALLSGTKPITQIAYDCGFATSSYFGKLFRAQFGCSPLEYRQKWHDRDI